MKCIIHVLLLCFLFQIKTFGQSNIEVSLPKTTKVELKSANGLAYNIYVSLPPSYSNASVKFPVIYILDADLTFGLVYNTRILMLYGREIPEVILIGIAYKEGLENMHNNRFRDLTPTYWSANQIFQFTGINGIETSGAADDFLLFINEVVKKFVHENYRSNKNDETLVGYSLSGLFAAHVASKTNTCFNKYLIVSPSLWWYNGNIPNTIGAISKAGNKQKIYTSIGSKEDPNAMVKPWKKFISMFKDLDGEIKLKSEVLENETHVTAFNSAFPKGIRYLFRVN